MDASTSVVAISLPEHKVVALNGHAKGASLENYFGPRPKATTKSSSDVLTIPSTHGSGYVCLLNKTGRS